MQQEVLASRVPDGTIQSAVAASSNQGEVEVAEPGGTQGANSREWAGGDVRRPGLSPNEDHEMFTWFLLPTLVVIVILSCVFERRVRERRFREKWPMIDDDEFVRRCSPGTRQETALAVRRVVAEQLGLHYDHIYPEQNFMDDLGAD